MRKLHDVMPPSPLNHGTTRRTTSIGHKDPDEALCLIFYTVHRGTETVFMKRSSRQIII